MKNTFFCYKFDKTTISQVKNQYDRYVMYFSKKYQQIITGYCGSLFVGYCNSQALVSHFYEFLESLKLSSAWLINIGMDGPSVEQSFLCQLQSNLQEKPHKLIDIGSCPLHIVNNGFKRTLVELKSIIDLDQIATKLHFFLKWSAAWQEDYKLVEQITEVTVWYMKKMLNPNGWVWIAHWPEFLSNCQIFACTFGEIAKVKGLQWKEWPC